MKQATHKIIDSLPPMFSHIHLNVLLGKDVKKTHVYLSRWTRAGWIIPMGGKTGIYFKDENAKSQMFELAITKVFPEAVLIGPTVMSNNNLTSQFSYNCNIAVRPRRSYPNIPEVNIFPRSKGWYTLIRNRGYVDLYNNACSTLKPEVALADMLKYQDSWATLAPDDLELDEMDKNLFFRACKDLNADTAIIGPYIAGMETEDEQGQEKTFGPRM